MRDIEQGQTAHRQQEPREEQPRRTPMARWLFQGHRLDLHEDRAGKTHPWYLVLWLTGVDYFSTLGYQPGIALLAAGAVSPIATAFLVAVTLFCALPIYAQVAERSYVGQGSIALLENLLGGWWGKLLILALLGFAATDFVITMTLSAADATQHAVENPFLHPILGEARVPVTVGLLGLLAAVFLAGFSEAIGLAVFTAVPYLLLTLVVLVRCGMEIAAHPSRIADWQAALSAKGDWTMLLVAAGLVFPRLALGLSGFETGVSVMPLIAGRSAAGQPARGNAARAGEKPRERIHNTQKLLIAAALIMSALLLCSSFITTLLVPAEAYKEGGKASGRAIAYLAHQYLGSGFGTLYDLSTILILWFAGASAMAGLLHLIPRYLPRFGMAPAWVAYQRPLVLFLFAVAVAVTLFFKADVEAQGGAYATGVLVLMLSAAVAAALALWREGRRNTSVYCWGVAVVFTYTLFENVKERPDGIVIASIFIAVTVAISVISRWQRAQEFRVSELSFCDSESEQLWRSITGKKVNLVPVRTGSAEARRRKAQEIARHYRAEGPLAFVHVVLLDNRSEFLSPLQIEVHKEGEAYVVSVTQSTAIANTIAYLSELIDPIRIFLGLTRQSPMLQSLRFLLLGEGETALLVYTVLLRYWEITPEDDVRPLIFLMSD